MGQCGYCSISCSSICSNCKKVNYCTKEHQKLDRKRHKLNCYPAILKWNQKFGNHFISTRKLNAGEVIWKEFPIIVGPRGNLPSSSKGVCLGCYALIPNDNLENGERCLDCKWPMCSNNCPENSFHRSLECQVLKKKNLEVPSLENHEQYLWITILRCIMLAKSDSKFVDKLKQFECHSQLRKQLGYSQRSLCAVQFIRQILTLEASDEEMIDRIYGILQVNGYSDTSRYYVKLYELGSKLTHSCIPNTRSLQKMDPARKILKGSETKTPFQSYLEVISTVDISEGEILTQLYGTMLLGTHQRQEYLQSSYHFTCSCHRCKDPTELGTYFSGILCRQKKCMKMSSIILPLDPINLNSAWICNKCGSKYSGKAIITSTLEKIKELCGMNADDSLFSEFEFYTEDNPDEPISGNEVTSLKIDYVLKLSKIIKDIQTTLVHKNFYGLLPVKTGIIATIFPVINLSTSLPEKSLLLLLEIFLEQVVDCLDLMNVLSPGKTRNRGILMFYMTFAIHKLEILKRTWTSSNALLRTLLDKVPQQMDLESSIAETKAILEIEPNDDQYVQFFNQFQNSYLRNN